ncbi:MAG: hypothetical protein ACPGWR_27840 [Ardenticatenaceae bacterium]
MRKWVYVTIIVLLLAGLLMGYYYYQGSQASWPPRTSSEPTPPEYAVRVIPLAGPLSESSSEVSGLAWYGNYLILLPQYPERFDNQLFALPKADILSFLDGELSPPLTPLEIPLSRRHAGVAPNLTQEIANFEGFEAIAFIEDQIFLTIEARSGEAMLAYLVSGTMAPDLSDVQLDTTILAEIPAQSDIPNYSDETLLVGDESLITIYEANGQNVNPAPQGHQFDRNLAPLGEVAFPNIEYRITDATALDGEKRFWATNYLFADSIDKLKPAPDALFTQYGVGATHAQKQTVERLLEFRYTPTGITLTDRAPVQLKLLDEPRNWEGLARLEQRGFLLVTDKFPETIFGFVPYP